MNTLGKRLEEQVFIDKLEEFTEYVNDCIGNGVWHTADLTLTILADELQDAMNALEDMTHVYRVVASSVHEVRVVMPRNARGDQVRDAVEEELAKVMEVCCEEWEVTYSDPVAVEPYNPHVVTK
jgi:deferrochelatase/peroxidase EfeB